PPRSPLFPYTTLFRSVAADEAPVRRFHDTLAEALEDNIQNGVVVLEVELEPGPLAAHEVAARGHVAAVARDGHVLLLVPRLHHRSEEHTSELQSRENL